MFFSENPNLTTLSSAQKEAPVAGYPHPMTPLCPSSPRELCSFSSSSLSSPSSSWLPSHPPSCRLLLLPHSCPYPSFPPSSLSFSYGPLQWLYGLPSYLETSPHSDRLIGDITRGGKQRNEMKDQNDKLKVKASASKAMTKIKN